MSQPFDSNLLLLFTVKFIEEALTSVFVDGHLSNKMSIIEKIGTKGQLLRCYYGMVL